ncbi:hypothetical protein [endosymbiont DhMRE of Dentiscutata heterogama]|uniref:hypothetical protein n=1 Tax=endosymbiont DhMRE of Dentiscutata heterogama TaxID=1609546 RepID=UPI0018A85A5B|nr:hypothetical protein [endosymbiont DhMRE of Dentiscutata heterogama]
MEGQKKFSGKNHQEEKKFSEKLPDNLNRKKITKKIFSLKDFKKWGKLGGRPAKYANDKERWRAYRRRKALARIDSGEVEGILNMTTGRINRRRR